MAIWTEDPYKQAQDQTALQRAAGQRFDETQKQDASFQNDQKSKAGGAVGGILGAIVSTYFTGNPMLGYSIGSKLGSSIDKREAPDMNPLSELFKSKTNAADASTVGSDGVQAAGEMEGAESAASAAASMA